MRRTRTVLLMAAMMSLVLMPSAGAVTERMATSGVDVMVRLVDPGRGWITEDGVLRPPFPPGRER